ncbi:C40 family peptidase [Clostridium estertheticum]|uniref:SH3 domain-containing protein n=1 Tax=Clostridium estertheticum TaxID=238834 RepID=A0A7Y3WTP6_9CLOT|nr:C40 family peptidase [Clostridium estertheticum]MBW9173272.1 C40 family peptidase [Clostridium estertheticum]NNU78417.1 SH3 domain-containing protein [Clostridium estertheticum]WBL47623.1 NlpC/P60 family protein [Clostridium estertheticum]WLC75782.1 C40 family peptidase [Clostridium estertheticum]
MKKIITFIAVLFIMASSHTVFADSGIINASSLCVRQKSSLSSSIITSLSRNTTVNTLGKEGNFYKINYKGKTGYIYSSYVKITIINSTSSLNRSLLQSIGTGIVTAYSLNVRKEATMGDNVIEIIKKGLKVNIYGTQNSFYKIIYNGKVGYISKTYISLVNTQSSRAKDIDRLMAYVNTFLGMPYLWGGTTPAKFNIVGKYVSGGFDCSGLVQYVYKSIGINLPRTTMDQVNAGSSININSLQKGDLVFFRTNPVIPNQVSHVGIYVGNNKFIQSPKTGDVIKTSLLTGYYNNNFVIGKRLIK